MIAVTPSTINRQVAMSARMRKRHLLASAAAAPALALMALSAGLVLLPDAMSIEAAVAALAHADRDQRQRARAELLRRGPEAVEPLAGLVAGGERPRAAEAASLLGRLAQSGVPMQGAVDSLLAAFDGGTSDLVRASAQALAASRSERALRHLVAALAPGKARDRRLAAADALGAVRERRAVRALLKALEDPNLAARARAALRLAVGEAPAAGLDAAGRRAWWERHADNMPEQMEPDW